MRLLHTMLRVNDLDQSIDFYCQKLGMTLFRKQEFPDGKFTLAFVGYGSEEGQAVVELTYNWGSKNYNLGDAFGHLAVAVAEIYKTCDELKKQGVKIVREAGPMKFGGPPIAFIEDPTGYRIELIERD